MRCSDCAKSLRQDIILEQSHVILTDCDMHHDSMSDNRVTVKASLHFASEPLEIRTLVLVHLLVRSHIRSLCSLTRSRAYGTVTFLSNFHCVLNHCALGRAHLRKSRYFRVNHFLSIGAFAPGLEWYHAAMYQIQRLNVDLSP